MSGQAEYSDTPLNAALRHFEAAEANLVKAEKTLKALAMAVPNGIAFGENSEHETAARAFEILITSLPKIDGWKPEIFLMDEIAQSRFDAQEVGEVDCIVSVERRIEEPSRLLREYRYRFNQKRRELVREGLVVAFERLVMRPFAS
jgi:hypothetical protein